MELREKSDYEGLLAGTKRQGLYPMERLKRVDQPTTKITNNIQRVKAREQGFTQAAHGHFGELMQRAHQHSKEPVFATLREITTKLKDMVDGEIAPSKPSLPQDPAILSRHIKSLGYFHRADIVGICKLPQWAVYSHDDEDNPVELNHQFAIVLLIDQGFNTIDASTGHDWISHAQAFRSYAHSAVISCMIASYIRKLGYSARAHHLSNELVVIPPLLLLAGIGEVSRPGIILNPFIGLRFKTAVVTTDLPLLPDKPVDFGLQEFCQQCGKCAVNCPSQAISYGDKVMHNGYEVWTLDYEKCLRYRILHPDGDSCGRCIKVCPWNKPEGWPHDMVRWMVKHNSWLDKFLIKMDDVWGYGKQNKRSKWWFDLERVDGGFQIVEGRKGSGGKGRKP